MTKTPTLAVQGETFGSRLLTWFAAAGRHDLPWQHNRTMYRVWISEVMLQQTQVSTAIPYFERFMQRFPTLSDLAAAPEDEVLHLWSGLGYYARARNLLKTARRVVMDHGGQLPEELDALHALPGIGRSTAGAILAQALNRRHAILDGNVKRVLARWGGIEGDPSSSAVSARLWALSEQITPDQQAADYTQAIMDLGATLCIRRHPACERCPVHRDCVAFRDGRQSELPTPRTKRARPVRVVHWLVFQHDGSVLLARRPSSGIWGGLHGFLEASNTEDIQALAHRRTGEPHIQLTPSPPMIHQFTHFELQIYPWIAAGASVVVAAGETWYNLERAPELGIAAPVAIVVAHLRGNLARRNDHFGS